MTGGTTSWKLGLFPSCRISRWRRGFGSFLRQKQNSGWSRGLAVQSETAVPTSTVPAVLTAPGSAQMPLRPPGGCQPKFDLFFFEWEVSSDREKLPGTQALSEGASFPWLWVYTQKPELRQCCSHHHEVMLIHEGVRLLLSLFGGAWPTGPVIRQKTRAKDIGLHFRWQGESQITNSYSSIPKESL